MDLKHLLFALFLPCSVMAQGLVEPDVQYLHSIDAYGDLRVRANDPDSGEVLQSIDTLGTTRWVAPLRLDSMRIRPGDTVLVLYWSAAGVGDSLSADFGPFITASTAPPTGPPSPVPIDTTETLLVGMFLGQSNAAGKFSRTDGSPPTSTLSNTLTVADAWYLRPSSSALTTIADNRAQTTVVGCDGTPTFWSQARHSVLPKLYAQIKDSLSYDTIAAFLMPEDGTNTIDWLRPGYDDNACSILESVAFGMRGQTFGNPDLDSSDVDFVVWMQGESDYLDIARGDEVYADVSARYDSIFTIILSDYPNANLFLTPPVFFADVGYTSGESATTYAQASDTINYIYQQAAAGNARIQYIDVAEGLLLDSAYRIPDGYTLGFGPADNMLHYDGQGQDRLAEMLFQWIFRGRRDEEP